MAEPRVFNTCCFCDSEDECRADRSCKTKRIATGIDDTKLCHCGQPLHYSDPRTAVAVHELVDLLGEFIDVHGPDGRHWRVQRHYIALHGLKATELPTLGFEEVRPI